MDEVKQAQQQEQRQDVLEEKGTTQLPYQQKMENVQSDKQEPEVTSDKTVAQVSASDTQEVSTKEAEAVKRSEARWCLRRENCLFRTTTKTIIDQDNCGLESSLKKCTALVRKLKNVSKDTKDSLLGEIRTLNLSMYISEICGAFFEAKFKVADVPAVVEVVSELYRRYPEFYDHFMELLFRNVAQNSSLDWNARRSFLHLAVELCSVNILPSSKLVTFFKETNKLAYANSELASALNAFTSVAKNYLAELLLSPPHDLEVNPLSANEFKKDWEYWILSQEEKKQVFAVYESLFEKSCAYLNELQNEVADLEKETNISRQMQGEVQQDTQMIFQNRRKQFSKLSSNIKTLCALLGFQLPLVIQDEERQNDTQSPKSFDSLSVTQDNEAENPHQSCFETEMERRFYVELPTIPVAESSSADQHKVEEEKKESDKRENEVESSSPKSSTVRKQNVHNNHHLEDVLMSLSSCSDMEKMDKWCVESWSVFDKSQRRKKLVKTLFNISFNNPEMIPLLSRLVASLYPVYPDISSNVIQSLKDDFSNYFEKKESGEHYLKCRIWNARWISEMTKFRLFPAHLVLSYVKLCMEDFAHYNVDIVCVILETCGRFLYSYSETNYRTSNLLDILWRLKSVKNLEPRHEVMVENAYYAVKPLDAKQEKNLEREPLKEFIHHLLFEARYRYKELPCLVKKLRKLPCTMEIESFLVEEFLQTERFPFDCLGDMAKVITEYSKYRDSVGIGIVDGIVEALICLLESQDNRFLQQRIAHLKLLGELFKTRFVNGNFITTLVYLILSYNDSLSPEQDSGLLIRIRMVCSLLETCGWELLDTVSFRKVETMLLYLLRTIWHSNKVHLGTREEDSSLKVLSLLPIQLQHLVSEIAEMYSLSYLSFMTGGQLNEKWEQIKDKVSSPDLSIGSLQRNTSTFNSDGVTCRSEDSFSNEEMHSTKRTEETDEREEDVVEDEVFDSTTPRAEAAASSFGDQSLEEALDNSDGCFVNDSESSSSETCDKVSNASRKEAETESFDQELFSILSESISEASHHRNAVTGAASFRPLLSSAKNIVNQSNVVSWNEQLPQSTSSGEMEENVPFQVLMKKSGRPQVRLLHIPSDSSLVTASRAVDEMEREEKEELKRLVLTSSTMQKKGRHGKR
jgi:regulator of nonsense transcripts 2